MQVARTSFSASSLSILPAVTSDPPEGRLFDRELDDVGRAMQTLFLLDTKRPDAPVLWEWDSTIQLGEQFLNEISSENVTAYTDITRFLETELAVTGSDDQQDEIDMIPALYEGRYWLRRPIPVEFEDVAADAVIAHFHEAELAVTGSDRQDAKASLALWIFDVFDDLAAANPQVLGRTPALQIRVLNEYLSRRNDL